MQFFNETTSMARSENIIKISAAEFEILECKKIALRFSKYTLRKRQRLQRESILYRTAAHIFISNTTIISEPKRWRFLFALVRISIRFLREGRCFYPYSDRRVMRYRDGALRAQPRKIVRGKRSMRREMLISLKGCVRISGSCS